MAPEQEIRLHEQEIAALVGKVGVKHLEAFRSSGEDGTSEPVFVADLDLSKEAGYSDRFFETLFGLQEIFARPIELWELHIFEREGKRSSVSPVALDVRHAA